ncbi:MAG: sporulation protein YhbH [Dehalococcoidales bacterium]|nr:sporulation protein YhbH [Dehalococcoidales bacterium]
MLQSISLSKHDWSLHRKGPADQARHAEKVKEAIKGNLANIISQEAIITSDGNRIVKVPIKSLELPRFRYEFRKKQQVGQGEGDSGVGDVLNPGQKGQGKGKQAGDQPGIDYYEAEITIEELAGLLFEDLGLPNLQRKLGAEVEGAGIRYNDIHKVGIMSNLDKKRTIMENIRRNALTGHVPVFQKVRQEDLRFRTWNPDVQRETNAVVIAMRDVSASMGEFEKYITRSFYFWMVRFLRSKYNNVRIVFITHHTEAKEVDEETFFKLGESGGTKVSSAYKLALDIIKMRYDPESWNIYPFHFSDGDNWGDGDNKLCVELVNKLIETCNIFGYGEIQESRHSSPSTLMSAFLSIQNERFIPVTIADKADVYPSLRKFFARREG